MATLATRVGSAACSARASRPTSGASSETWPCSTRLRRIEETHAVGRRHRLETCSWGHAGDGNLHATFLVDAGDAHEVARAQAAAEELFSLAARLGGTISGEHGVGLVKGGRLALQWSEAALGLHEAVKRAFDPKGLFNPGKKLAR